jgi:hypothetical protein
LGAKLISSIGTERFGTCPVSHGAGLRTTSIMLPSLMFFNSASGSTIENENFSWSSFVAENRDSSISLICQWPVEWGGDLNDSGAHI